MRSASTQRTPTAEDTATTPLSVSDRLWTVTDVSHYLGVPVGTLYQWRSRRLGPPGLRVGRHLRYRPAEVARWLDESAAASA